MPTPRRIELLIERRLAIVESGLTLDQLEALSQLDRKAEAGQRYFTERQRWLWRRIIFPIGLELRMEGYTDESDEQGLEEA